MQFHQKLIVGLLMLLVSQAAFSRQNIEVTKSVQIKVNPDIAWAYVGHFCAIKTWHDAVVACNKVKTGGKNYRLLTLANGATVDEMKVSDGSYRYSYKIVKGPFPVKDYRANFMVTGNAKKSTITWTAKFNADGVSDAKARAIISDVFESGLSRIKKDFQLK